MTTIVYLGPSLPIQEAREVLPDATYRPPAAQADIVSAIESEDVDTVVLIDGTFRQSLSVWHSEICYALSEGIRVVGASSMGALRAAETAEYGAIGIGRIYDWYKTGKITGDDEVALLHGDQSQGYRGLSEPLVNVRATLEDAVAALRLDARLARSTLDVAKRLFFPERSIGAILLGLSSSGVEEADRSAVEACLRDHYVDQKKLDAVECLHFVAIAASHEGVRQAPTFDFTRSYVFETLYNLDRRVTAQDGNTVPLQDVAEHVALHHPEFSSLLETALNRGVLSFVASVLDVHPGRDDLEEERRRFAQARQLTAETDVEAWRERNHLNSREFDRLIGQLAAARALRRWLLSNRGLDRGVKYVLDELRLNGEYPRWAEAAAEEHLIATAYGDADYSAALQDPEFLVTDHVAATGFMVEATPEWAFDAGFEDAEGVVEALRRAAISRDVRRRIREVLESPEAGPLDGLIHDADDGRR